MTKKELIDKVSEVSGFTKRESDIFVDSFIQVAYTALKSGDKIALPNLLTMETVSVEESIKRNPKTGEDVVVPSHRKVKIKAMSGLKNAVK